MAELSVKHKRTIADSIGQVMPEVAHNLSRFSSVKREKVETTEAEAVLTPREIEAQSLRNQITKHVEERNKRLARAIFSISPVSLLFFGIALFAVLFIVYSSMKLTIVQNELGVIDNKIKALDKENIEMENTANNKIDLNWLSEYATNELKMTKVDFDNIVFVDISGEERTEIIEAPSFFDKLKKTFSTGLAYVSEYLQ